MVPQWWATDNHPTVGLHDYRRNATDHNHNLDNLNLDHNVEHNHNVHDFKVDNIHEHHHNRRTHHDDDTGDNLNLCTSDNLNESTADHNRGHNRTAEHHPTNYKHNVNHRQRLDFQ
jgi:hypothetical protein